jgi:regulator of Ty1 transposition protein 103
MSKINFEIEVVKKLETLNETQLSIETVSRWLIFHKRNAKLAVKAWKSQFAPPPPAPSTEDKEEDGNREVNEDEEEGGERLEPRKRLYLLYLANDVLQNGRKKGGEYVEAFREVMKVSFPQFVNDPAIPSDLKVRAMRVLKIWEDRGVFDSDYIQEIKNGIHEVIPPSAPSSSTPSTSTSTNVSNGALSTANGSHNNNSSNDKLTKYVRINVP